MSILVWLTLLFMIFAVLDPSPLTVCINCSFLIFIFAVLLPVLSRLLLMSISTTYSIFFNMAVVRHIRFLLFEISAAGLACNSLLCTYVCKNVCHTQVVQFFVRAIRYQFVKIVLRTCTPRWSYSICRTRTLMGYWTGSLSSVFSLSVYFWNDKNMRIWPFDCL